MRQDILDFYLTHGPMTSAGDHAARLADLPRGPAALATVIQGLLLHEHWAPAYGVTLTPERRAESQIRTVSGILDAIVDHDPRPLTEARSLDDRVIGTCRDYTVLFVAMLRAQGVPARARCGFGAYFEPGLYADHWVGEYWNAAQRRWIMVDAQVDPFQASRIKPDFDLQDVPHDRFLIGGDAWRATQDGKIGAQKFGIMDMRGPWFIAGNVVRDGAALAGREMLPWDCWGTMPGPGQAVKPDEAAFLDRLSALCQSPDERFDELRAMAADNPGLRVPPMVFNAVLNRPETV